MQVRRLMEEDNSKRRRAARREFQDNVRALVAFVRKRDIRVDAWVEEEERKKAERAVLDMRRQALSELTSYAVPWGVHPFTLIQSSRAPATVAQRWGAVLHDAQVRV